MKLLFRSFYAKISGIFLLLVLLLGAVQAYITYRSSMQMVMEAEQKLNLPLARNMAAEFEPEIARVFSVDSIEHAIHYMMVMNPKIEIYLLNEEGDIMAFFAETGKEMQSSSVNLDPVRRFLDTETDPNRELILGDDPRFPGEQKPFSAAEIEIQNRPGFLYIILGSEQYQTALNMLRENYILRTSLSSLGIAVLMTGIIGLVVFAVLTRRIRTVKNVVRSFEQGETGRRIDNIFSDDEIGSLARSFNEMADTIENQMEKMRHNDSLRRELVANVSHDLRSPLASIRGYLETILIRDKELTPEQRNSYLQIIFKNTLQLSKLVQQLFELSKLEAKDAELNLETFSVAELAQDIIIKLKPDAEKKDLDLAADIDQEAVMTRGDIALLERAITNLLQNAIEHTPRGGIIRLITSKNENSIQITVEDNGPGIDQEDLPHIFDRFYRGKKNHSQQSMGLGLAITHKIVELHQSTISVESQKGMGTTFQFELETA